MKGKINKSKEEVENDLDEIMKTISIGKKYEITGNDYNITITPINCRDSFKSAFVDFSFCEEILRKEYNMSEEEILTILQIEIDKMDDKALTNQIEYEVYNEKMIKLNLSYCNNVEIKIIYDIKNLSLLNNELISYYSDLGIDIFNRNDSFFNDLCYPFSISNSDVILKDRVLDIYQNFSLCDHGCEYNEIDIVNMSITCSCQVKTEVNITIAEPTFAEMIKVTFKDSNFGVIRCYKLVFNFTNKFKNMGFLISLFFVFLHVLCFLYYFFVGIKSISIFVFREMEKNNYMTKINNPKKKKNFIKNKTNIKILRIGIKKKNFQIVIMNLIQIYILIQIRKIKN